MSKNVSMLLGAGVSVPAGLPSTAEITEKLFDRKFSCQNNLIENDIELVLEYLRLIYKKIDAFYTEKSVNYEDMFYITTQLKDFLIEYENPIVASFAEDIIYQLTSSYHQSFNSSGKNDLHNKLSRIASIAGNYINDLTTKSLQNDNIKTNHLSFIEEIVSDNGVGFLNIFTLNHDIVIEKYLNSNKISYYDGFIYDVNKELESNIRVWQSDFFKTRQKIRLLKLHGSIDWFRIKRECLNTYQKYFFAQIENIASVKDLLGEQRPLILTGRFNKILEYNRSIYVDLHYNFYRLLPTTNIILISGYSFNDKGINSWLIDWMYAVEDHKIILIHPKPNNCIKSARYGIKKHWLIWQKENKIITISIPIEDFSWKEYTKFIMQ